MIIEAIIGTAIITGWNALFGPSEDKSTSDSSDSSSSGGDTGSSSDCNLYDGSGESSSDGQTTMGDWM